MKRSVKSKLVTWIVIIVVILVAVLIMTKAHPETDSEVAKCIGENAVLYTQLGCHACEKQKDIFGDNYEHLNVVDCWFEREKCGDVEYTPTWIIKGEKYVGLKSIQELKELTDCE